MKRWFTREKSSPVPAYDPQQFRPAILCSICTGEQTAGFQDVKTGKFTGVCLVSSTEDLEAFRRQYGITGELPKIY